MIIGKIENRRRCDNYAACEECDCYSQYTEKIKQGADEFGYEEMKRILELGRLNGLLSWLHGYEDRWQYIIKPDGSKQRIPTCTKEQNCLTHYCNPNGIYSERDVHEPCRETTDKNKNCDTCKYASSKPVFPNNYDCNRYYSEEARGGFKMGSWVGRENIGTVCDDWEQCD